MAQITLTEIAAAYEAGCKRISGEWSEAEAIAFLVRKCGMNTSSANDYIDALRHMFAGEVYKRTISATAANYFLDQIYSDFGVDFLSPAITSLDQHIDYYEQTRGVNCRALRAISSKHRARLGELEAFFDSAHLDEAVAKSLALPPSVRQNLLPKVGHKPKTTIASISIFARSPHVIAAALERANGVCECCKEAAPFTRKSNGQPSLEVDHKTRLADSGDDTLENVEALCPNCHRQRHYG